MRIKVVQVEFGRKFGGVARVNVLSPDDPATKMPLIYAMQVGMRLRKSGEQGADGPTPSVALPIEGYDGYVAVFDFYLGEIPSGYPKWEPDEIIMPLVAKELLPSFAQQLQAGRP